MTDTDRTAQLERACSYLRRIPAWYLATTDASDGHQPRVRPFSFAMVVMASCGFARRATRTCGRS